MPANLDKEQKIQLWIKSSDKDFRVMNSLFKIKHYSWALFIGHLVIEKLLKACYVKNIEREAPFIHNLLNS